MQLNISLVIYCQHLLSVKKIYDMVGSYAPFFTQCLIVLNLPTQTTIPLLYPAELKNVAILSMPDQIDAGGALNKIFPHLTSQRVLLVDSRVSIKKEILTSLRQFVDWGCDQSNIIISFQNRIRCSALHRVDRRGQVWHKDYCLVKTLSWGAVCFDPKFLLDMGYFDAQLSEDALMADLSLRVHQSTGLLLESIQPGVLLKECYEPSPAQWRVLRKKHPQSYPSFYQHCKKIFSKLFIKSKCSSKLLN